MTTDKQTDKQTGQKQYVPDHSIRGHKNSKIINHCIWASLLLWLFGLKYKYFMLYSCHTNMYGRDICKLLRKSNEFKETRGPKGHISCTWVQCATFFYRTPRKAIFVHWSTRKTQTWSRILLSVKFRWIRLNGFRREVENVSANQRPGRPSCFFHQLEKYKLGRGRWDLASYQVSLNSDQRFQRRSRKCLSQSEARAAILFFRSARKTQTWQRTLRSCFLSSFIEFRSAVSEKSKMSQPISGQGDHLVIPFGPKTQTR